MHNTRSPKHADQRKSNRTQKIRTLHSRVSHPDSPSVAQPLPESESPQSQITNRRETHRDRLKKKETHRRGRKKSSRSKNVSTADLQTPSFSSQTEKAGEPLSNSAAIKIGHFSPSAPTSSNVVDLGNRGQEMLEEESTSRRRPETSNETRTPSERSLPVANEVEDWEARYYDLRERFHQITSTHAAVSAENVVATPNEDVGDPSVRDYGGQDGMGDEGGESNANASSYRKKWMRRSALTAFVLILASVSVVVVVAVSSGSKNDGSPSPSTQAPTVLPNGPWQQLGQDLIGAASDDYTGWAVSLSQDATVLAVGSPQSGCCLPPVGYASVYQLDSVPQSWTPMGQKLVGNNGDALGSSLSLNGAGDKLAVGAPNNGQGAIGVGRVRVYQFDIISSMWIPVGNEIVGQEANDEFGVSVSLSLNGSILAVGASQVLNSGDPGNVRIFQLDSNGQWRQLGQTLVGQTAGDRFGFSVALSSSGMIVGVGGFENDSTASGSGHVSVYQYSLSSSSWVQMGTPISGGGAGTDWFGYSVSLDGVGFVLAVGSPLNDLGRVASGSASVYEYDSELSDWIRLGQVIVGEAVHNEFGFSVSLSRNGNVLAVGARWNDEGGRTDSGHVRIFQYIKDRGEWNQVGSDLDGEAVGDEFGFSVSLAGNSTAVVAVGSRFSDRNGDRSGHASVYTLG